MLIELFSLGVTAEALRANIGSNFGDFAPTGAGLTQNLRFKGSPSTNHSSSH